MQPKYPDIQIELVGTDSNAFAILGKVNRAIRGKIPKNEMAEFQKEAMSGDYDNLLQTCMKWFNIT